MTPETRKKAKESREAQTKFFASQIIKLNDNWKIIRDDEWNWAIIRKGHEKYPWFYGKLSDALLSLPHKILDEKQIKDIKDVNRALDEIKQSIDSLMFSKFENYRKDLQDERI